MRYVMEAATDAAALLLFDPAALPSDFEHQFQSDANGTLERLHRQGLVCWIPVAVDGYYLLHVYLNEPVPPALRSYLREQPLITHSRFLLDGSISPARMRLSRRRQRAGRAAANGRICDDRAGNVPAGALSHRLSRQPSRPSLPRVGVARTMHSGRACTLWCLWPSQPGSAWS